MSKGSSLPPTIQRIATSFRITGWVGFWVQLVLGVVSSLILLFAVFSTRSDRNNTNNPGTGFGLFLAVCGILVLAGSLYWTFMYTRLGRRLQNATPGDYPKKGEMIKALQAGLIVNLVGMLLTLLGAESIIGVLLAKSLTQGQGAAFYNPSRLIEAVDIFVVQANTNVVAAHFAGIITSLWLLRRIQQP